MKRGILATQNELHALRARIAKKPFDAIYDALRRRCSLILESSPVTEQQWRAGWQQGVWGSAVTAARTAQGRILDLLIAHRIDPNAAFRDRAIEELKNLIGWSTWTDPCHAPLTVDLCTAEAGVAAAIGLDWLYEDLGEADKARILQTLRHRVVEPYIQAVRDKAWWYNCYHAWNAVVNSGCGLVALALDDEPAAREAHQLAHAGLRHFFDALGREGGWDEGTGYWGYALRYLLLYGEACDRLLGDKSIFHERGMETTGTFGIYFTPNGKPASFGDQPTVPTFGAFYLLTKHFGLKEVTWWLDTYAFHRDAATTGWSSAGLAMIFRPDDADITQQPDLAAVKVFHEIGWAAMADRWPRPGLYVAVKTGDLSANHSQRDMNSIQLQVDGEMLLRDLGHAPYSREYLYDQREEFVEAQARGHNTLILAERDHRIDAQGSILEAQSGPNYRWVASDAGEALGENVHFIRHSVMLLAPGNQGTTLVVLDEVHSPMPQRIDLFWHTAGRVELAADGQHGSIAGSQSELDFALAGNVTFETNIKTHDLGPGRSDRVIHISTGPVSLAMLGAVFCRQAIKDKLQIKQAAGQVRLKFGETELVFKAGKRHLQLESVTEK